MNLPSIKGRVRCPYVAIPIPGERPFVVERERFERVTRGLNITDVSLDKTRPYSRDAYKQPDKIWALTIVHRTGNSRGRYVFYNVLQTTYAHSYWKFKDAMASWAERARKARVTPKESKFDKQVRALKKELEKLYFREGHPPVHPLQPSRCTMSDGTRKELAARELAWYQRRADRREIGKVAALVMGNHITAKTAYEMLRTAGYQVMRYSDITESRKRYYGIDRDGSHYWRSLYRFCGIGDATRKALVYRASHSDSLQESLSRHAEARLQYLTVARQARSLQNQISSIEKLAAVVPVAKAGTGLIAA